MMNGAAGRRGQARALLTAMALAALGALCAWGGWVAAQPELDTFLLPGARDIRQERIGPGLWSLTFNHDGPVVPQSIRLHTSAERRGWQISEAFRREDCEGLCLMGSVTLIFTRQSLFHRIQEAASVEQRGVGPYYVRVVLRRCIQLPSVGCWPPA